MHRVEAIEAVGARSGSGAPRKAWEEEGSEIWEEASLPGPRLSVPAGDDRTHSYEMEAADGALRRPRLESFSL